MEDHVVRWKRALVALAAAALLVAGLAGAASTLANAGGHSTAVAADKDGGGSDGVYQNGGVIRR
jgi:hypothetical protein